MYGTGRLEKKVEKGSMESREGGEGNHVRKQI
jgi:hypothetical protein